MANRRATTLRCGKYLHPAHMQNPTSSGVESDAPVAPAAHGEFLIAPGHTLLIQATLRDQTDHNSELLQENEWLMHPSQREISLRGNAFALEDTLSHSGTVFLKLAAGPQARASKSEWDVRVENGALDIKNGDGYAWATARYEGGKWGRIVAAHALQRAIRPYNALQDGLLLSNTWGDRARDAHLSPQFMAREIESAARLGADVVQIDDGWQQGVTANSSLARAQGGAHEAAWNGFWASDPNFWDVNRARFPDGLRPLVAQAHAANLKMGLWFAPDSSNGAANWQRDVAVLLRLHHEEGIDFFKVDALKIENSQGEANLKKLFETVRRESQNRVLFDFDITAEDRFGYFGLVEPGALFVENRYTDWGRYWPHATLRAAWQLSHWVDPLRLRLEWLNNARHGDKYLNDPLAPREWQPDALFATVMFCSPLGWFEVQNLPPEYFESAAPLIATWKEHRARLHAGTILPIGGAPDGDAWTGFVSIDFDKHGGYALIFREHNADSTWRVAIPLAQVLAGRVQVLGGEGTARMESGVFHVEVPNPLGFVWARWGD